MAKRRTLPNPMCWRKMEVFLRQNGCSDEVVSVARMAYSDGLYSGLHMLGATTSTVDGMVKEWHEYYSAAKEDFSDELKKFKVARQKGGS